MPTCPSIHELRTPRRARPVASTHGAARSCAARCLALVALLALLGSCGGGGGDDVAWALSSEPDGGSGQSEDPGSGTGTNQGSSENPGAPAASANSFSLPVLIQEALPSGQTGTNRLARVATFGVPIGVESLVQLDPESGRPLLAVPGSPCYQFSVLKTWPSGAAKWVKVDVLTDVPAGAEVALEITGGTGASNQAELARDEGGTITIDTGPLQASLSTTAFDLFETVVLEGVTLVDHPSTPSLFGTDANGAALSLAPGSTVWIEENGPARCVVRADGTLLDGDDDELIDVTVRVTARRASRALEVTYTVRNATEGRQQHVPLGSLGVGTELVTAGAGTTVTLATPPSQADHSAALAPGRQAFAYQSYSAASTTDVLAKDWLAPIDRVYPVNPGDPATYFSEQGYQIAVDGSEVLPLGDKNQYPRHGFVDLRSEQGGLTLVLRQMPYLWPASLEADGDGRVAAGLFPERGPNDYTFLWQQHESRSLLFAFHIGAAASPESTALEFDYPLAGRAADYGHYDRARVLPYRLVTVAEHQQALALMGIDTTINVPNEALAVTRYLATSTTGGSNNYPSIQTRLGGSWLRHGNGGAMLSALDLALWKAEWQIRRSDDFTDDGDDAILAGNDALPHTKKSFSDDEHRYREGIALAYYVTGDPRYRDALYDEAEVLRGVDLWEHERSMYRTLVAMAQVIDFTGDTLLRDTVLLPRLAYITEGTGSGGDVGLIDVCADVNGAGWEGPPLPVGGIGPGDRRYYTFGGDLNNEKPPKKPEKFGSTDTEYFQARGFITGSYGPTGYYHAAWVLDPDKPLHAAMHFNARSRMRDLSWFTMNELFPYKPDPADRRLLYSYPICLQLQGWPEDSDFHPILVGMAESYRDYAQAGLGVEGEMFLVKGVEQIEAAYVHGDLANFLTRLDCQHFMAIYREWALDL